MKSINSLPEKQRRAARRRSHFAKDLRTPKYGQRRVENKKVIKNIRDLSHRELIELINEKDNTAKDHFECDAILHDPLN
jgi:hypothetical protein